MTKKITTSKRAIARKIVLSLIHNKCLRTILVSWSGGSERREYQRRVWHHRLKSPYWKFKCADLTYECMIVIA